MPSPYENMSVSASAAVPALLLLGSSTMTFTWSQPTQDTSYHVFFEFDGTGSTGVSYPVITNKTTTQCTAAISALIAVSSGTTCYARAFL